MKRFFLIQKGIREIIDLTINKVSKAFGLIRLILINQF
jgi:hypothetical protein